MHCEMFPVHNTFYDDKDELKLRLTILFRNEKKIYTE